MPMSHDCSPSRRIASIDALRGADMLLLAGGAAVLRACAPLIGSESLQGQLTHAAWGEPLTCWDMVMPLFIFIVGASMPFAFAKYREAGLGRPRILLRVGRRCLLLFLLGMLVQGHLASADPARMSLFCNTLQAIAEGYFITALCLLWGGGIRSQALTCLGCLLAYWAALRFIPYAGRPAGLFLPRENLAYWVDCALQGRWQDGTPYSWILTSLSFGALTLLGALGGQMLRLLPQGRRSVGALLLAAAVCLLSGRLLALDTPIIKHIYTSSMVLWSGGWCFALLALFHLLFDICPRAVSPVASVLNAFGANAILAYLLTQTPGLQGLPLWRTLTTPLFGGVARLAGAWAPTVLEFLSLLALYLLLRFLQKRRISLRV